MRKLLLVVFVFLFANAESYYNPLSPSNDRVVSPVAMNNVPNQQSVQRTQTITQNQQVMQSQQHQDVNGVNNYANIIAQPMPAEGIIQNSPLLSPSRIIVVSAKGEGVARPDAISPAQARALARRAAIADAYRALGEKMYGIRLSARDRVRDLVTQRTEVRTAVDAMIKAAKIDEESWKNGLYTVSLVVKLDACLWSRYLHATPIYRCGR